MVNPPSLTMKHLLIPALVLVVSSVTPFAHATRPVVFAPITARPVMKRVMTPVRHITPHAHHVLTPRANGITKAAPRAAYVQRRK